MNYYEILGIPKTATQDEIKAAYRTMAKKYHPDKNNGDKAAEEMFKKVNEAYTVLSDEKKRKMYDSGYYESSGSGGYSQRTTGGTGEYTDPFQQFWENWARAQQEQQRRSTKQTKHSGYYGFGLLGMILFILALFLFTRILGGVIRIIFSPIGLILLLLYFILNYRRQ